MPEGDTLHKVAGFLAPRLEGHRLEHVEIRGVASPLSGEVVEDVSAVGKHLLIQFENGLVLRSHLGMYGSWHRYASSEPWRKPRQKASIVLRTATDVYVCFDAKSVDCGEAGKLKFHPAVGVLGPDILADLFDLDDVLDRAKRRAGPRAIVADVLLDQTIASGIGNVYKCEVLFLHRLHPETPLERLGEEELKGTYETARGLMQKNLRGGMRRTRPGEPRHWVYGRGGRPCLQCGTTIERRPIGDPPRTTYFCPHCQKW